VNDVFFTLHFTVNGQEQTLEVPAARRLLDILRLDLGLTGPKEGCSIGRCGACSVVVDGDSVPACLLLACQVQGRTVETIEGLREDPLCEHISAALVNAGALQCGYCTPGIVSSLTAALRHNPAADVTELEQALHGNLCRCTGYNGLRQAIAELAT